MPTLAFRNLITFPLVSSSLLVWWLPHPSALPEVQQLVDPASPGETGTSWKFCLVGGLITTVSDGIQKSYDFAYDPDLCHWD